MFLSHLHSDHIADLASLYIGAMFGRTHAWEVFGPSGETEEVGTAEVIQGLRKVMLEQRLLNVKCVSCTGAVTLDAIGQLSCSAGHPV